MATILRGYVRHSRSILREELLSLLPEQGSFPTPVRGFSLHRFNTRTMPKPMVYTPVLLVVVQGKKWVQIGGDSYIYDPHSCFVAGVDMPVFCCVHEATPEKPYLALTVDLDHSLLARLSALSQYRPDNAGHAPVGAGVSKIEDGMLDSFVRLLKLLSRPEQIPFLAPLFREEIHYRLLAGPLGRRLSPLYKAASRGFHVATAIHWLRDNFKSPLCVSSLADRMHMANSTFHKNFKKVTTISPLQYQKRLRLNEAHKLLLSECYTAPQAALEVGYESPAQFNRDYKRLFGLPPGKDLRDFLTQVP